MIDNKSKLKAILSKEYSLYFHSKKDYIKAKLTCAKEFNIWAYQKNLRYLEYYKYLMSSNNDVLSKLKFIYYSRKVNKLGLSCGIDSWCDVFDEGLVIFHSAGGIVVNSNARIGKNCHLHGNNCIGNKGKYGGKSPIIGDNCTLGVGAKVLGDIKLGDNIIIAAGAVVVKSCLECGAILAGVPAHIVGYSNMVDGMHPSV